jgi:hypothetical protein
MEVFSMTTATTADSVESGRSDHGPFHGRSCSHKGKWSKLELATMIGGFIVFWPVGLLALGAKLVQGEMWPGARDNQMPWTAWKRWKAQGGSSGFAAPQWKRSSHTYGSTGNAAFDAYKKEQLERLEAERRKLEEEQKAFAEYLVKLREAKDKEEFDRFMSERAAPKPE